MFQFVGYDFFSGPDALNSAPNALSPFTSTTLRSAIFDHFNVTKDTDIYGDKNIPDWTYDTILNASFDDNVDAGNIEIMVRMVKEIKVKRREKGKFDWITLKTIPINTIEDFTFSFNDFLNAYNTEYDYALVPVMQDENEGEYIINSITSKFNGIFVGDEKQSFRFLYDVQYSNNSRNQQVGTFSPLGRQYPIIIANGELSYESGEFSGMVVDDSFDESRVVNRADTKEKLKVLNDFLTNKKPKIIKDENGNIWLVIVTSGVQISYKQGSHMGIPQINFGWSEIGKADDKNDLYDSGMIESFE